MQRDSTTDSDVILEKGLGTELYKKTTNSLADP